ncbi:MAG: DUF4175 family protein [Chitinophagales bacterium]
MSNSGQYHSLIEKLDRFIRKYYTNQLIRGIIFSAVYILGFFLAISVAEYYLYMAPLARKILFYGFILSSIAFVARFVALPLMHYYKLGSVISYAQAAQIIGTHFTEVKDKLLNILQLHRDAQTSESALLLAAIDQKAFELKPIDFSFAIDLSKNRKYLRYLAPPALLFLVILIAAPNVIKDSTKRLYHNDTYYEKEAPFQFVIVNKDLKALQFENYELQVKTTGDALPAEIYLESDKTNVRLKKKEANLFTYEFTNLQKSVDFRLMANGFHSKNYTLTVVAKPVVAGFEVSCDYPAYTGKQDEVLKNLGDLVVPEGTKLRWRFNTQNVEAVKFLMGDSTYNLKRAGDDEFVFAKTFMQSTQYVLKVSNSNVADADSVSYSLNVTPDLYPVIAVNESNDTATKKYFYYVGEVSDDYGLRKLTFNYQLTKADSASPSISKSIDIAFTAGISSRFTYYWSLSDFNIKPGDKLTYYFEVWDNDGIHGSKSSRSNMMLFQMPTMNELNKEISKENKELKEDLKQTMKDAKDLKNELQEMQDKLMDKNNVNWEDKKNIQESINKQKALEEQLKEMKDKLSQNFEKQNELKDVPQNIKEKQKNLQELFDKVLDEEMKKLYDKLEKMLEDLQKKDALDKMADMQMNNEKMEKELDRMLELFKKLEFDQKLEETAQKLDKLADKQEELSKKTEQNQDNKGAPKDQKQQQDLKEQQQKLNEELKDAKKDMQDLNKLNEETKSQQDFKDVEQNMESADKQQQESQQQMDANNNKASSKAQKSASSNMKSAAQKLGDMKMQMEQEQEAEDMQAIRQLLENIVKLSFDEEKLMADVKATNINNPKYVDLMKEQQRIRENSKMVEDSLYAVAKRQESIKSFVTKEITSVNKYLAKSISDMEDRNIVKALGNQQFVMTGYNNLALMLSEALQQMQQQMSESQQQQTGNPKMCMKCKKPGNGLPNLSKMQKQLNDKISQMAEMKKQEGQGGSKPSSQAMAKQFAEMAQMQEQIRRELERINQEENKNGQNPLGNLGDAIEKMKNNETELVNKQLTTEMLKRQQEIMTRLLEAENAQRQRDEKPERESNTGKEGERKLPPSIEEYLKAKQSEVDLYKTVPPSLKPYYKALTEKYFRNITAPTP